MCMCVCVCVCVCVRACVCRYLCAHHGSPVVSGGDGPEPLLSSSVPATSDDYDNDSLSDLM